jgi:hypothetical protein
MFPNIRLQIVALFVSVVALSFGFGVFAAFQVNHEPLVKVPAAAMPQPRPAENGVPTSTTTSWGAPFGSRFWLSETQIRGAADLPPLTPVVRHDVTERTITWIVVTGSAASAPAPMPQPPAVLPDVQSVDAPLAPKQGSATETEQAAAPAAGAEPAAVPAAVVGATESAAQVQPEMTSTVAQPEAQEPKALQKTLARISRKAAGAPERRRVVVRAPMRLQPPVQSVGQREEPVVFQSAPPQPRPPQRGAPVVARSGSQNSMVDAPVFQTAPPSQR